MDNWNLDTDGEDEYEREVREDRERVARENRVDDYGPGPAIKDFEEDDEGENDGGEGPEWASAVPATPRTGEGSNVFGTEFSLEELAARPGQWQALAAELIVARQEREAKAKAADDRAALEAMGGEFTDADPAILKTRLLAQVDADRASANEAFLEGRRALLAKQFGAETVALLMRDEQAAIAKVAAFEAGAASGAAMREVPAFRDWEAEQAAEERARGFAARYGRTLEDDLADAKRGIEDTLARYRDRS